MRLVGERNEILALSIIIPFYNERDNVIPLLTEIQTTITAYGCNAEIICIDDGSTDGTGNEVVEAADKIANSSSRLNVVLLQLKQNFGQSNAVAVGIDAAQAPIIVTLDGDCQNDPADIPAMLNQLELGADVVCGWRRERHDNVLKVMPSRLANWLIRQITGLTVHDIGCTLRVYRAGVIKAVAHSGLQHRYIPIQCQALDASLVEVETNHRTRRTGQSKYGLRRIFTIIRDLPMLYAMANSKDCARPDKTDQLRNLVKDIYRKNCITQPLRDASTDPEKISNGA